MWNFNLMWCYSGFHLKYACRRVRANDDIKKCWFQPCTLPRSTPSENILCAWPGTTQQCFSKSLQKRVGSKKKKCCPQSMSDCRCYSHLLAIWHMNMANCTTQSQTMSPDMLITFHCTTPLSFDTWTSRNALDWSLVASLQFQTLYLRDLVVVKITNFLEFFKITVNSILVFKTLYFPLFQKIILSGQNQRFPV